MEMFFQLQEKSLASALKRMLLLLLREKKGDGIKQKIMCLKIVCFTSACVSTHPRASGLDGLSIFIALLVP